jgi:hypothetical protein
MAGIKHTKGVLDLTFMDIGSEEALTENLRSALTTQIKSPSKTSTLGGGSMDLSGGQRNNTMGGGAPQSPSTSPKKPREPELVKAVRLSNNLLENMEHMNSPFMATVDTSNILWLDLSFNKFVNVSEAMAQTFPNITTIYLHANNISRLSQLRKLRSFPNLKSLSLYGNPVEEHKHYRNYVLSMCPHVTQFDSSPVTSTERKRAVVWSNTFRKVLNREDDDENY